MASNLLPSIAELGEILGAQELAHTSRSDNDDSGASPAGVCIDSRQCRNGDLFFALSGEHTDGHRFVSAAARSGAVAAVVRDRVSPDGTPWPLPALLVADALDALQRLARWYVERYLSRSTTRIGITGSNGKTTTKEMLATILKSVDSCFASVGNLNSETGLPLSVLATPPDVRYAVYEMAMSNPGEMARLARIVRPHYALITNIGTAHIGLLGSRRAIAEEKKRIASQFDGRQVLILPEDDDFRSFLADGVAGRIVDFGPRTQHATVVHSADDPTTRIRFESGETVDVPFPGEHNGLNALAALAAAGELGVDRPRAASALAASTLPDGRSQLLSAERGRRVLNDSYNANPDSMAAAIGLARSAGATVLILGDMYELGAFSAEGHRVVLDAAVGSGARVVCLVGPCFTRVAVEAGITGRNGAAPAVVTAATVEEAEETLKDVLRDNELILVKGSRALALERLLPALGVGEDDGA